MIRYKIGDVETAGFKGPDEKSSGVVEVAWLEIDPVTLEVIDQRSGLINPQRPIESGASETHGLFDSDVAFSPVLSTFYRNNWDDSPTVLIAHNIDFDKKFLAPQIQVLAGEFCTLKAAREFLPDAPNHKLATLAAHYGLPTGVAHRAAGDVYTTLGLLKLLLQTTNRTLQELIKLQTKPSVLTVMPFGTHKGKSFNDLPVSYLDWILATEGMPEAVTLSARMARTLKG